MTMASLAPSSNTHHGSPLMHLVSHWSQQPDSSRPSYKILLQHSTNLPTRLMAKSTVENPQIYQRAGVRTPPERATRDFLGGLAWLTRIMELGLQSGCKVILVRTLARPSPLSPVLLTKVSQIRSTGDDAWGWDTPDNEANDGSVHNLLLLAERISSRSKELASPSDLASQDSSHPIMLVWESLNPLLTLYGFETTHLFLDNLDKASTKLLQVWPVRVESLLGHEHAQLEDSTQALLSVTNGGVTLVRQGVREAGKLLRDTLAFDLAPDVTNTSFQTCTVKEFDVPKSAKDEKKEVSKDSVQTSSSVATDSTVVPSASVGRGKVVLQHEEENAPTRNTLPSPPAERPRIFLQDDDPEFDDLDEEDPDDDLDI
eukprot:Nitzschia sp. Nitz4//scaffold96_size78090//32888//34003//NITZ4_005492-RA/size78090-processed-gene-0.53-mRNA-1//-1//CDS//3329560567//2056//frame0